MNSIWGDRIDWVVVESCGAGLRENAGNAFGMPGLTTNKLHVTIPAEEHWKLTFHFSYSSLLQWEIVIDYDIC